MSWGKSKSEQVVERLGAEMHSAQLRAGDRLGTKETLRARFQVAPATINEALRLLKADGLVDVRTGPGGGVFVSSPPPLVRLGKKMLAITTDPAAVADAIRIRHALEPLVVEEATRHATKRDIEDLDAIVDRMEAAICDDLEFLRVNLDLHRRIAAIGRGALLTELYNGLLEFIDRNTSSVLPDDDYASIAGLRVGIHRDLVRAIGSGDPTRAAAAEADHRNLAQRFGPASSQVQP